MSEVEYSKKGLQTLSPRLRALAHLPFTSAELRYEAAQRAGKLSIQGVQPKLSAKLEPKKGQFTLADINGRYIIKPQSAEYPELPENEDLTMHLATIVGIEVPQHGLLYAKDLSLNYFIRRFDRVGQSKKIAVEDFAQLDHKSRETKYDSSMERVAGIIQKYCTFPVVEKQKLFKRVIFNFLIGNEDMHLKNYSLISKDDLIQLAPAYDFLNSSIVLRDPEEIALPLNGRKRNLTRSLLCKYWGNERLELAPRVIEDSIETFKKALPQWEKWIERSFLSKNMKQNYQTLLRNRCAILDLT